MTRQNSSFTNCVRSCKRIVNGRTQVQELQNRQQDSCRFTEFTDLIYNQNTVFYSDINMLVFGVNITHLFDS